MALYLHWLRRDLRHHLPLYVVWFCVAGLWMLGRLLLCHEHRDSFGELFLWLRMDAGDFLPWCLAAEVAGAVLLLNSDPPDGTAVWWKTRPPSPQGTWLVKLTLCVIGVIGIPLFWELVYAWIARPVGGWSTALALMALPLWPALCISPMLPRLRRAFFLLIPLALATGTAAWFAAVLWKAQTEAWPGFVLLAWGLVVAGVLASWMAWTRRGSLRAQIHTGLLLPGVMLLVLPVYPWLRDDDGFPVKPAPGVDVHAITAELTFPDLALRQDQATRLHVHLTLRGLPPRAGLWIRPEQVQLTDAAGNQASFLARCGWIDSVADLEGRTDIVFAAALPEHAGPMFLSCRLRTVLHEAVTVPVQVAEEQSISLPDGSTGARMLFSGREDVLRVRVPHDRPLIPSPTQYDPYYSRVMNPCLVLRHKPTGVLQIVDLALDYRTARGPARFLEYITPGSTTYGSGWSSKPPALALWGMPDGRRGVDPELPARIRSEWSAELTFRTLSGTLDLPVERLPVIVPRNWKSPGGLQFNSIRQRTSFNREATEFLQEVTDRVRRRGKFAPEDLLDASQCLHRARAASANDFAALLTPAEWRWAADMCAVHGSDVSELDGVLARIMPAAYRTHSFTTREGGISSNLSRMQQQILDAGGGRHSILWSYLRASEVAFSRSMTGNPDQSPMVTALIDGLKENQLWARAALLLHQTEPELRRWLSSVSDCPTEHLKAAEWIRSNAALVRWDEATGRLVVP